MKITEKQLADLFQDNSKNHTSSSEASDCLAASAASSKRLNHLEDLISDHHTAKALKASLALSGWSQVMAKSIENSQQSWFSFLGMNTPLKTAFATVAFAFVFVVAMPEYTSHETSYDPIVEQNMVHDDVINTMQFDGNNDQLSKGGFDYNKDNSKSKDSLFNASFG